LVVQVEPAGYLNPTRFDLEFRVSANGTTDVTQQSRTVAAWVRALPGHPIRLAASFGLTGPGGPQPLAALRWSGRVASATAGGRDAVCTSGQPADGTPQDLAAGWTRSGTLICDVTFSLANPANLAPGLYSSTVVLRLLSE
jgi:hypothetical protein